METRICRLCGIEKNLNEFNKNGKYYRTECIECKKIYTHNQYFKNREHILERTKKYREENQEWYKSYREKISDKHKNYCKEYYIENKEHIQKRRKRNAEHIREMQKKYREENQELIKEIRRKYYENNPHYHRDYDRKRLSEDELYKFKKWVRTMIRGSFHRKGLRKGKRTTEIIGCDYKMLQEHLLNSYKEIYGEEWDGKELVHIDHIVPLSIASTEEEIIELCHYTNLQLLKASDNLEKGDKLDWN